MFAGLGSPMHILLILVVVLLLFGAKRIPELAKGLGSGVREFKRGISGETDNDEASAEEKKGEEALDTGAGKDARNAHMREEAQRAGERAEQRAEEHAGERADERTEQKH